MPSLFGTSANTHYPGPFELVRAQVTDIVCADSSHLPIDRWWRKCNSTVDRNTRVRAVPLRRDGSPCEEYAVQTTLGELCLRRTRELVYNHIGDYRCPGVTNERRETYIEYSRRLASCQAGNSRGRQFRKAARHDDFEDFGPADAFLSHSWGDAFADTVDAVLPNGDECYQAMVEPSREDSCCLLCYILKVLLHVLMVFAIPGASVLLIPLGRRAYVLDHVAHPRWWTPNAVRRLGAYRVWLDIFCKNQHIVNSDGTAEELRDCVTACGTTILACTPWDDPALFKRVWCQYEIHYSMQSSADVVIRYPDAEKRKMDKGMYRPGPVCSWVFARRCARRAHSSGSANSTNGASRLGYAVSQIQVANAQATVASDRELILRQIAGSHGGDRNLAADSDVNRTALAQADGPIRTEIFAGIFAALGGARRKAEVSKGGGCALPPRRPRRVPWGTRVAMYTLGFQVSVPVAAVVWRGHVELPGLVLWFVGAVWFGALSGVALSMSAKTHQLCTLLDSADPSGALFQRESAAFRRERLLFCGLCFVCVVLCAVSATVGGIKGYQFIQSGLQNSTAVLTERM
jgi:hypothetical protein